MPYCYATGGGYGRYLERRRQPIVELEKLEDLPLVKVRTKGAKIVCVETGAVYDNTLAAARAVGFHGQATAEVRRRIVESMRTGGVANGYRWREVPA